MLKYFGVLFAIIIGPGFAQDLDCTTPFGHPGSCINIKHCDELVVLLRTQINNPEVRNYLMLSTCGFIRTTPRVCCPNIQSQFRPTTSTQRTVFTTPWEIDPVFIQPLAVAPAINRGLPREPNCGFSNNSDIRVVGGVPANLGEFPWMVALGYHNPQNSSVPIWLCGGTLITDRHILTAAHCIYNQNVYVARIGDLNLFADDDGATPINIPIVNKKIHEDYNPSQYVNDIAILTMQFKPSLRYVWPVCLPVDNPLRSNKFERYNLFVAGWGAIYLNGPSSSHLQKVVVPVVSTQQCKNAFARAKNVIDERVLCAGYTNGGKDACRGDSGGPLMYGKVIQEDKFYYQTGIVSYGYKCAEKGIPGVYTRVTEFIDWIERNIN